MEKNQDGSLNQQSHAYQKTLEGQTEPPLQLADRNINVAIILLEVAEKANPALGRKCRLAISVLKDLPV